MKQHFCTIRKIKALTSRKPNKYPVHYVYQGVNSKVRQKTESRKRILMIADKKRYYWIKNYESVP
jgi:hypothetical protein